MTESVLLSFGDRRSQIDQLSAGLGYVHTELEAGVVHDRQRTARLRGGEVVGIRLSEECPGRRVGARQAPG